MRRWLSLPIRKITSYRRGIRSPPFFALPRPVQEVRCDLQHRKYIAIPVADEMAAAAPHPRYLSEDFVLRFIFARADRSKLHAPVGHPHRVIRSDAHVTFQ